MHARQVMPVETQRLVRSGLVVVQLRLACFLDRWQRRAEIRQLALRSPVNRGILGRKAVDLAQMLRGDGETEGSRDKAELVLVADTQPVTVPVVAERLTLRLGDVLVETAGLSSGQLFTTRRHPIRIPLVSVAEVALALSATAETVPVGFFGSVRIGDEA